MSRVNAQTSDERSLQASLAAHAAHAKHGSEHMTRAARKGFDGRFDKQVDPDGILPPDERAKRAEHARKAYMKSLSLKAAKARRLKSLDALEARSSEVSP